MPRVDLLLWQGLFRKATERLPAPNLKMYVSSVEALSFHLVFGIHFMIRSLTSKNSVWEFLYVTPPPPPTESKKHHVTAY